MSLKPGAWEKLAEQVMGDLPDTMLMPLMPFQVVAINLFGPFTTKDMAKSRRQFKTWGCLYICMATRAVTIFPCAGYDTKMWHTMHAWFVAIYGRPSIIRSDHATRQHGLK